MFSLTKAHDSCPLTSVSQVLNELNVNRSAGVTCPCPAFYGEDAICPSRYLANFFSPVKDMTRRVKPSRVISKAG
jgi:hypothetical protein